VSAASGEAVQFLRGAREKPDYAPALLNLATVPNSICMTTRWRCKIIARSGADTAPANWKR